MYHVIMTSSMLSSNQPDDCYIEEYNAAKKVTDVHLFSYQHLDRFKMPESLDERKKLIYHGWMMSGEHYKKFFDICAERGYDLVNTPEQYDGCHYFNNWYPVLEGLTPKSIMVEPTSVRAMMDAVVAYQTENNCAVIIKDYVKSLKHLWHEACFIPQGADAFQVAKVIARFNSVKTGDNDFQGKLVVRQFVNLKKIGEHSKSKMPLTQEYRFFVLNGKLIHSSRYWNEGAYDENLPPQEFVQSIADRITKSIGSNFFTIDVAQLEDNSWTCIEVGEGQVSAVPQQENISDFFTKLVTS